MKRVTLFALLISVSMVLFAQATDLVVDNQNPGWLSNVISFGDQKTVNNLKVTGYINETDLQFIGTLMARELNGRIDLSEVNVVDVRGKDNFLGENMFGLSSNEDVQYLDLPTSCKELSKCLGDYLTVDTLYINCNTPQLNKTMLGNCPYNIIIGENVDSIGDSAFEFRRNLGFIMIPSTIKYIGESAFAGCANLTSINYEDFYQTIDSIAPRAFMCEWFPDTIIAPLRMNTFVACSFNIKNNAHVFIHKDVTHIINYSGRTGDKDAMSAGNTTFIHCKNPNPPSVKRNQNHWAQKSILYVPKGSKAIYQNSTYWNNEYLTIIEENPLETVLLDKHSASMEIGEILRLIPTFIPSDADDKTLEWSVKDESVAKVENGVVTALAPGKTWVYASSVVEDVMDSCEVTVIQHVTDITFDTPALTIEGIGVTAQLNVIVTPEDATDKSVTWTSSNPSVCVVSNGKIVSVGYGMSVVIATSVDGGHMAVATVNVSEATDVKAAETSGISVQGTSFGVRILNAANETANIYTPDGVLVKTVKVTGAQMDVELPEGSIYLVKIVDKTVKVSR